MTNDDKPIAKPSRPLRSHSATQREALHAAIDQLPDDSLDEALELMRAIEIWRNRRPITESRKLVAKVRTHLRIVK